jgi:hypothetical protein
MPDAETLRRRRFLVLHDTLPRGTGYLHRLADQVQFREVLESARRVVETCRCQHEGRKACHRCLLSYIDDDKFDLVSRAVALDMLKDLLDDWQTAPVASTGIISLRDQVESELEARFLAVLETWARSDSAIALTRAGERNGRRTADLHISLSDNEVAHWQVTLQNTIEGTRPDVVFQRVDAAPMTVAVYLDGYAYHAAPKKNRLADDADKRARLRAGGDVVFQLDWDDVNIAAGDLGSEHVPWQPYQGNAQTAARTAYAKLGGDPADLAGKIWCNPVYTLFAFLGRPDLKDWKHRTQAAVAGLLRHPGAEASDASPASFAERVRASLQDRPLPPRDGGSISLIRVADLSGCPLTVILDQRHVSPDDAPLGAWSALAVIDDRKDTIEADEEAHRRRWSAWLYWGNLVQFLSDSDGDGAQLAYTTLDDFEPSALVAGGGVGWLSSLNLAERAPDAGRVTAELTWPKAVVDLFDVADLVPLIYQIAALGVPPPEEEQIGYELGGDQGWQAEIVWEKPRVAVLADGDPEGSDCAAAFTAAGWDARPARAWPPEELARRILGAGE